MYQILLDFPIFLHNFRNRQVIKRIIFAKKYHFFCEIVAYMKIIGLESKDNAWLSMLFVAPQFQHQGVGKFAIDYAEKFVIQNGFEKLSIQTTTENIPAQNLYKKCGYAEVDRNGRIVFVKQLNS